MLLDTSGFFAYLHVDESTHSKSKALFESNELFVTHSLVLVELIALCTARGLSRVKALEFVTQVTQHPSIEIIWVDRQTIFQGLSFLTKRLDKSYSLCDAVSFLLMKERGISEALTTDKHFAQEGFTALLQ